METKEFNRKMSGANNGFLHLFINLLLLAAIVFGTMGLVKVAGDGAAISFCIPDLWRRPGDQLLLLSGHCPYPYKRAATDMESLG